MHHYLEIGLILMTLCCSPAIFLPSRYFGDYYTTFLLTALSRKFLYRGSPFGGSFLRGGAGRNLTGFLEIRQPHLTGGEKTDIM